jgi:ABC-type dipeptide/oligopeptide/nickel transport system permease subunit
MHRPLVYSHDAAAGGFAQAAITITVKAFNLLGDGIRDALDPRLRNAV